jgi:fido (protein-threonine AMPylation protein)
VGPTFGKTITEAAIIAIIASLIVAVSAGRLYATILAVHPFVDGNLRAAFVALHAALLAVGIPRVAFGEVLAEHDLALGWATRSDDSRTIEPLAALMVELLKRPAASDDTVR